MAIRTEQITLDIRPCCDARGPVVCGRQGDEGTVVAATVTQGGGPMALDGLTATLKGNVPGYTETTGTVDGSTATFALDSSVFAHRGVHQLYVELSQGADVVASTQSIELRVAPGADASAGDAEDFESFVDQMKADYEAGIDQAEAAFDAALDAKQQEAQGLIDELDDALDTLGLPVYRVDGADAVPQKECYFSYEDADMGCDVFGYSDGSEVHQITPAWQTQRGSVVQAAGCAVGVPVAGARVYGETRQNLWPMLSSITRAGVTITVGDDGSISASGTSTGNAATDLVEIFTLKPGGTYTLSPTGMARVQFVVIYSSGGTSKYIVSDQSKYTFTLESDASDVRCYFQVLPEVTVNATFRPMLNEGSEPQPWCPPGLSSVSELGVVSAGKNLLDIPDTQTIEAYGGPYTFTMDEDGWVSCSKDSDQRAWGYEESNVKITLPPGSYAASIYFSEAVTTQGLQIYTEDGTRVCYIQGGSSTASQSFALDAATEVGVMYKLAGKRARVQLELGSTATAYEPPAITTTPVDLSGHQLRSLPDGTRDVLTVDGSGAVSVEQAVRAVTFDGSSDENWTLSPIDANQFRFALANATPGVVNDTLDPSEYLCDRFPKYSGDWTGNNVLINGIYQVFVTRNGLTTVEGLKSWLAQNPMTLVYPVATPTTVHLDPITPPTVPASDATLWAASDVPCDLEATTWTAPGAEQGRQQAAMVVLAQQVRQQAETVAALAAQSLEA